MPAPPRRSLTTRALAAHAAGLRREFDQSFADPRHADGRRFCWDPWHVPGQYSLLRTPAWTYFSARAYQQFHQALVMWGRRVLGCHDVSPPWLSLYVDGCEQRLHGDLPHGPWAFVFSLTRWPNRFISGGETLLARDSLLSYWADFTSTRSVEEHDLFEKIPPRFGQLLTFDPRLPHGVNQVVGSRDPRHGRLVISGWFVQPRPFIDGPAPSAAVARCIDQLDSVVADSAAVVAGALALRISITAKGAVSRVQVLTNNLRGSDGAAPPPALLRRILGEIRGWQVPARRTGSVLTLPLVFERV